ncbi:MAG TPA: ATP phosphoribosyltransferase regulatory subunit [Gammaproteobacteria bacterium]|nr:ATP phosphoribosyltransferase regulatory subunit [Gammaproteobacteria bacterium]
MPDKDRWLLPEGIEDILPPQAERLEWLRRDLLDLFHGWGYELVIPPLVEYLESLLTGTGNDLNLQTFKITDQLTGRLMGVRADMTPQVARIDAHRLQRNTPTRLCYLGTVLHTRPDGFSRSRNPLQVGAELYGHAGIESDSEILTLMLEVLRLVGIPEVHIDLGHVGIFRGLAHAAGLTSAQEATLFEALQRKAKAEIEDLLAGLTINAEQRRQLISLVDLNGGDEVLAEASKSLAKAGDEVKNALANLQSIATAARRQAPEIPLYFDLAELRGYHYYTGVVFAAFVPGHGQAVAQGGRYDDIGRVFGRARPATGFGADLRTLLMLSPPTTQFQISAIAAPAVDDPALYTAIHALREQGERVICMLPGQAGGAKELGCDRVLVRRDSAWVVVDGE